MKKKLASIHNYAFIHLFSQNSNVSNIAFVLNMQLLHKYFFTTYN